MSKYMIVEVATGNKTYTDDPYMIFRATMLYMSMGDGTPLKNERELMAYLKYNDVSVGLYQMMPSTIGGEILNTPTLIHFITRSDQVNKYILVYSDTEKYEFETFYAAKEHIKGITTNMLYFQVTDAEEVHIDTNMDTMLEGLKTQIYRVDKVNTTLDKICVLRVK